ncbi:MAG: SVM family protein [Sweet potato little leaf phytoplasma]|nr:SVM family protein [Sweet potato little leaf phytoplasma]
MFKYNNPITIIKNYVLILLGILLISINNHSIMATKFNTRTAPHSLHNQIKSLHR